MLAYAFDVLDKKKSKAYERLGREDFDNIYDLLASLVLCGTSNLLKRGLLRSHISHTEELSAVRGRVKLTDSMSRMSFQNAKAMCEFDEFSANFTFNQILKATLLYLKSQPINKDIKYGISKVMPYFAEISNMDISLARWDVLTFSRNNAHYDALLYFCRLAYEEAIANQSEGKGKFVAIEDKLLPDLFERFICAFYEKKLSEYLVKHHKRVKWESDNCDMLPDMETDTTIEDKEGNTKLIIETKFSKNTVSVNPKSKLKAGKVKSGNLYQIYAYVKNAAAANPEKTVSGLLLYPQVTTPLKNRYDMGGNLIHVRTVDLNQDFKLIEQDLLDIFGDVYPA
jgi:5-methylcytosine-specific restriction enzyme subunit McrC